jgi:endonuclease/exonuclease/phosphatase family metal-dependent hydrolase
MPLPDDALSRRRLLRATAGLAASGAVARPVAAADAPELDLLTRNLYVGVDLSRLFDVTDLAGLRRVAGDLLAEVRAHPYDARAAAIAAEIDATAPDVVCVQEAALVRTRDPSRFDGDHDPGAETVEVDLLAALLDRLADRGLAYDVASAVVTNDVEVPADTADGTVDVRLTDRVAVLARADLPVSESRSALFDAGVPIPLEDVDLTIRRGYAAADVHVSGRPVAVVSSHLEAVVAGIRDRQAAELVAAVPADRPVVVGVDSNVGPGRSPETYDRLLASFADAHATRRPDEPGHTCCHDPDLVNDTPTLSSRLDQVLYRGGGTATAVDRVGAAPGDRVRAEVGGESVRVWPSDHAGVVASVTVPAAPTPTAPTPSRTAPRGTDTGTSGGPAGGPDPDGNPESQSGFGVLAAVVAAGGATIAALRRHGGDAE